MKYFLSLAVAFFFAFVVVSSASADNNCQNTQKFNWGSANNNCNNNSNWQTQSQTQNNNQSVNVTMPAVQMVSGATALPQTGPVDASLYPLLGALPLGLFLQKKSF